jgi:phosphosulfolactate synthase (CoM biosynthesis protein A)
MLDKKDFFRFNVDDYLDIHQLDFEISNENLSVNIINRIGSSCNMERITSIYYRRPMMPEFIKSIKDM